MAGISPVQVKESFFSIFRWTGIDDIVSCFNDYFRGNGYFQYIKAKKTERGGFFLNMYDLRGKIAHMSFHKGDRGLGGVGQTHFKFDDPPSPAYGIGLKVIGESRDTITSISIEAINYDVDRFLNSGSPSLRKVINNALSYVFTHCAPSYAIRSTPNRRAGETAATSIIPGGRVRGRATSKMTPKKLFGGSKARMTKKKRKVNGVIRNIRISKIGHKYVLLKGKKHYL